MPSRHGIARWKPRSTWLLGLLLLLPLGTLSVTAAEYGSGNYPSSCPSSESPTPCGCELDRSQVLAGGDELWLVSTRHLSCPEEDTQRGLDVNQYLPGIGWTEEALTTLAAASADDAVTVFYVHGNRMEWYHAEEYGWILYNTLRAGTPFPRRLRLVVWSWPSGRMKGLIRDARAKAARADVDAYYFAKFLAQLPAERRAIVCYSFGARIVTGALHLLQGGSLCGRALAGSQPGGAFHVVMLAPAVHNHWLTPGGRHERALDGVASTLIFYNLCDPVLRRYRLIEKHAQPQALGYRGIASECLAPRHRPHVRQVEVCDPIGKSHDELRYYCSDWITQLVREQVGRASGSSSGGPVPPPVFTQ